MEKVLVIGAGFMGGGIAQVCAQSGYQVFLTDTDAEALEKAIGGIKWSVEKFVKKGVLSEPLHLVQVTDQVLHGAEEPIATIFAASYPSSTLNSLTTLPAMTRSLPTG